ncbi:MAG: hypothetical protein Q4B69_06335, partial [Slackia sp.]|nr:hypothetical protein [Slackia sp.]
MWIGFFVAMAAAALFLYAPGFFFLKALRLESIVALCCAPLAALFVYVALSSVYPAIGVSASWGTLFAPCLVLGVVSWALSCRFAKAPVIGAGDASFLSIGTHRIRVDWAALFICVVASLGIAGWTLVVSLDGPGSFSQAWDNVHHLGSVQAFLDSGVYSSFTTSAYAAFDDKLVAPFVDDAAFYPSAWHCVAAMIAGAAGIPAAAAVNALNAVIAGIVLPAGFFVFIRSLAGTRRWVLYCAAFVPLLFAAFPWGFLVWGPLYPNLLSYSLVFICMFLFTRLFAPGQTRFARTVFFALAVVGMAVLAFAQPNGLFTLGVLLASFLVAQAAGIADRLERCSSRRRVCRVVFAAAAVLVIAVIWAVVYESPFVAGVVAFDWPAKTDFGNALVDAASLACVDFPAQPVLALAVLVGCAVALTSPKLRWLAFSYLFAFVIYTVDMSIDGPLKHLLAGFWYTDQWRTAAMLALSAMPLAAFGFYALAKGACALFARAASLVDGHAASRLVLGVVPVVLAASTLLLPHVIVDSARPENAVQTLRGLMAHQNSATAQDVFDPAERAFVEQAVDLLGEDELIINDPGDGSVFAYPFDDARTYYRYISGYYKTSDGPIEESGEKEASFLIRTGLDRIASDADVKEAVAEIGAEYVLILDYGWAATAEEPGPYRHFLPKQGVPLEAWEGIASITDET